MKRYFASCIFLLCFALQSVQAQRQLIVFDPEVNQPVRNVMIWADHRLVDSTNYVGEAIIPEKFDTLTISKYGYVALQIPARWVSDSIPVIRNYGNIGEVIVYGNDKNRERLKNMVSEWSKEERIEYELRNPKTGIDFRLSDLFDARARRDRKNRKKMEKLFRKLDQYENDPIMQAYREALKEK